MPRYEVTLDDNRTFEVDVEGEVTDAAMMQQLMAPLLQELDRPPTAPPVPHPRLPSALAPPEDTGAPFVRDPRLLPPAPPLVPLSPPTDVLAPLRPLGRTIARGIDTALETVRRAAEEHETRIPAQEEAVQAAQQRSAALGRVLQAPSAPLPAGAPTVRTPSLAPPVPEDVLARLRGVQAPVPEEEPLPPPPATG